MTPQCSALFSSPQDTLLNGFQWIPPLPPHTQHLLHPSERSYAQYRVVSADSKTTRCMRFRRDGSWFIVGDAEGVVRTYRSSLELIFVSPPSAASF